MIKLDTSFNFPPVRDPVVNCEEMKASVFSNQFKLDLERDMS